MDNLDAATVLPVIFMALMGVSMLAYVILDGFDLGVGMLLPWGTDRQKDLMVSSIGPFWDANETWLVLGVGILLIAFPKAHGMVLSALYLPVAVMLLGLMLRGVAFDFRVKARDHHKTLWNRAFFIGSVVTSLAQGWMLGRYVTGFQDGLFYLLFAAVIALTLPAAYLLLGAGWLIIRADGSLQDKAIDWAKRAWPLVVVGLAAISIATPLISGTVRDRWFTLPAFIALMPIPLATIVALLSVRALLNSETIRGRLCWTPFALIVGVFILGFLGLAYSLYPYVVIDRITIWEAASATKSLWVILIGTAISVPAIIAYTIFAYRIFWGKTTEVIHYG